MKKVLLILCLLVVILLAAPILYVWACGIFMNGKKDSEKITYLTNNCRAINPSEIVIPDGFVTMPGDTVPGAFIFGEVHGFSPTRIFDAKLFMSFNREYGVRAYCGEMFEDDAALLNEFLTAENADKEKLETIIEDIAKDIPQDRTEDFLNEWLMLYEYNRVADAGRKMKVFGLLGDKDTYMIGHRDEIMASSLQSFKSDSAASNGVYCSVGIAHALGAAYSLGDFTVPTFASLLSGNGIAAKSMVLVPINSACYLPKKDEMISPLSESTKMASSDGPLTYSLNIINLKKASEGIPMAIYDLSAPGSPFNSCTDFVGFRSPVPFITHPYGATSGHSTTDYFQYILMIQDQPSPVPLN